MKTITYDDPTGGGDDITVSVPDWVRDGRLPLTIHVQDLNGDHHAFERQG